jgi:hypothetical protein
MMHFRGIAFIKQTNKLPFKPSHIVASITSEPQQDTDWSKVLAGVIIFVG